MADAWASLLGAVIGGALVLVGDGFRRRAEVHAAARRQLFDAAIALAATYNRIGGALIDGHDRGEPQSDVLLPSTDRYELQTRFWATPGSAALTREAGALSMTWTALVDSYDVSQAWPEAERSHIKALRAFEAAIRREMGDSTPLPETGRTL
jgi:hypothetical protein